MHIDVNGLIDFNLSWKKSKGMDVDKIFTRVPRLMGLAGEDVWAAGKQQHIVNARIDQTVLERFSYSPFPIGKNVFTCIFVNHLPLYRASFCLSVPGIVGIQKIQFLIANIYSF